MVLNTVPQIQALCLTIVRIIKCLYVCMYVCTGWAKKLDCFSDLITL